MSNRKPCHLRDIRQLGPNSERDISGICSCCSTTLLTRMDSASVPTRSQLEQTLHSLFLRHINEEHAGSVNA